MSAVTTIPQFLLPRGIPSARTLHTLTRRHHRIPTYYTRRAFSSTPSSLAQDDKSRVLGQPDKFRPPSHPARRIVPTRNGKVVNSGPMHYGARLTEKEKEEQNKRQYPHMFPPEGTVMFKFLTSRWIHVWIAMSVLTSLATFTFTTNFKRSSPFAHLLPPWSALLTNPFSTISQALSIYRMDVEHKSVMTREKRLQRVEDAEKRRRYRVAHGLEEDTAPVDQSVGAAEAAIDDQSPLAPEVREEDTYVDFEGNTQPVRKKWFGIW